MTQVNWDARTYNQINEPHMLWGARVIDRLGLRGDEVAMDAGCGSGRVTRLLLERLPEGRIYGVDVSPAMLAVAVEELAAGGERVMLIESDLTTARLPEPVDAVFSNATFHWIWDHEALFTNLASLMKPGARISAQCGGAGCVDRMVRYAESALALAPFSAYPPPGKTYNFIGPVETRARMEAAGFTDVETWLEDQPVVYPDAESFRQYLKTIVLGPFLGVLPAELHDAFVAAVVEEDVRDGERRTVDYVRLNMTGRKAG